MLAQVTLSVLLLIGAGLFMRSVDRVASLRLGYDADRLLAVDLRMRNTTIDSAGRAALRRALLERAERNPIVQSATLACSAPFSGTCTQSVFVAGVDSTQRLGEFVTQIASPRYFETVGTRVLRGRGIVAEDRAGDPLVAVVSEAMALALWPGQDPLGKCSEPGATRRPAGPSSASPRTLGRSESPTMPGSSITSPRCRTGNIADDSLCACVATRDWSANP